LAAAIVLDQHPLAIALLAACALSDWADGWLARRWSAGTLLHPADDSLADTCVLFSGTLACVWTGLLPAIVPFVVLTSFAFYLFTAGGCRIRNRLGKAWGPLLGATLLVALMGFSSIADRMGTVMLPIFALACACERLVMAYHRQSHPVSDSFD
jgi:phosphatidylglycerophosphate synthase